MRSALALIGRLVANPFVALPAAVVIAGVFVVGAKMVVHNPLAGTYVPVTNSSIAASASVEGIAKNGASTDLSFLKSGQVASLPAVVGAHVLAGSALVSLAHADLDASLAGAQANLEAANAKLAALQAGTRPEQVAIDQTAVAQAQAALWDAVRSAEVSSDDAVHNRADQVITNPRTSSAKVAFALPDTALENKIEAERVVLEPVLMQWSASVSASSFGSGDPSTSASQAETQLHQVGAFLDDMLTALAETPPSSSFSAATIAADQSSINTARVNVSSALSTLTSGETALKSAQGALTLAHAGATTNDVNAAKAAADAAAAAVQTIRVQISQSTLVAPLSGTITAVNAHIGQTVGPGVPVISLTVDLGAKSSAIVVPASAVFSDASGAFVYVKGPTGTPVKTPVTLGIKGSTDTEITSGLEVGQEVLSFGTL